MTDSAVKKEEVVEEKPVKKKVGVETPTKVYGKSSHKATRGTLDKR